MAKLKRKTFMKMRIILIAVLALLAGIGIPLFAQMDSSNRTVLYYTCPMHPSVSSNAPGTGPHGGMQLEPFYADEEATNAPSSATNNATADTRKPIPYPLTTCVV